MAKTYIDGTSCKAVTGQYLWEVFTEEKPCLKRSDVKQGYITKYVSKQKLVEHLEEELGAELGFDEDHLPDR